MSTTITTANHILVEKNSNRSDISLCPRAPWSMSLCSLLPTVPSTTNPHLLYVARHVNSINNSHFNHHHQSILRPLKKILTKMIHPNVSDLPGLLLQVVLAVHGLVDHQLTCTKCGQTCWKYKKLSCQPPSPQHITSLLKKISAEVIHPHVSKLPGLVLLVVLAVHSALNHQTTWAKTRQVGYP